MKYKGQELIKRIAVLVVGLIIQTTGIALFLKANIGLAPVAVFNNAVSHATEISFGMIAMSTGIVFLIIAMIWDRKYVSIGTFLITFFFGPIVDLVLIVFTSLGVSAQGIFQQIILFAIGYVVSCLGLGLIISARMGVGSIEAVLLTISSRTNKSFKWVKVIGDFLFFAVGSIILVPKAEFLVGTVFVVLAFGPGASLALRMWDKINFKVLGLKGEYIK